MTHVYLCAGDRLTLTSGAIMTAGRYGGVIDSQVRYDTAQEGFFIPANPRRKGSPYGVFELSSAIGSHQPPTFFDVYLDLDTNGLWYDNDQGFHLE